MNEGREEPRGKAHARHRRTDGVACARWDCGGHDGDDRDELAGQSRGTGLLEADRIT